MDHPVPLDALVLLEIQETLEQVVHQDLRDLRDCQVIRLGKMKLELFFSLTPKSCWTQYFIQSEKNNR